MRQFTLIVETVLIGLFAWGCAKEKEETPRESPAPAVSAEPNTASQKKQEQEAAMGISLQWLGHSSFKISHAGTVVYIDPWRIKGAPHDATVVLVSHSHPDHYSPDDIEKVSGPGTRLLGPGDVVGQHSNGEVVLPGLRVEMPGVNVAGVPAYNLDKDFHPRAQKWLGFVIEIGSKRIYYAGDTDVTMEMKAFGKVDVMLLPVGGTYTMDAAEAAEFASQVKPQLAIPCHWGAIVGERADADKFAQLAKCEVKVLSPGEKINVP